MTRKQIRKLDKLWGERVRAIGYCEYCNSERSLNSHHIITRSNRSTRWLLDNGICLCPKHHIFCFKMSAHGNPLEFIRWLEREKGVAFIERLRIKSREIARNQDFEVIKKIISL